MVVHYSNSVRPFFCGGGGEFLIIAKVYSVWMKAIETSVWGEFVGLGGCGIVGKFCKRLPCWPAVLPIVSIDAKVLLECPDSLFTKSICLGVGGSREV